MNTKIDVKSALVGLVIGVLSILAIGAGDSSATHQGRYQIVASGNPTVFAMVDTETGRVWMANGTANQLRSDPDFFQAKRDK